MGVEASIATAAWLQVGATLLVGVGAVLVAWVQLRRYNDTERITNTLRVLDDYYRSHTIAVGANEMHVSPATSIREIVNVSRNEAALGAYFEGEEDETGRLVDTPFSSEMWQRINIANDYLFTVQQLLQRKVIDRELTLISLCKVIQEAVGGIEAFSTGLNLDYLRGLAAEAKTFEGQLPASLGPTRAVRQEQSPPANAPKLSEGKGATAPLSGGP